MGNLLIKPAGEGDGARVNPKFSNWRRRAKVPILLLNTTSLNSGHNWHFTATWMGEPPGLLGGEVDKNERYRRLYYDQAPTRSYETIALAMPWRRLLVCQGCSSRWWSGICTLMIESCAWSTAGCTTIRVRRGYLTRAAR